MKSQIYDAYTRILHAELVPALGCTEPIAIAFAAAKARQILGAMPETLQVNCSGNIIKNVKGVVVPNSGGRKGIAVAAALGALGGNADLQLEALTPVTEAHVQQADDYIAKGACQCGLLEGVPGLRIEVTASHGANRVLVAVANQHTHIVTIEKNGELLYSEREEKGDDPSQQDKALLNVQDIVAYADALNVEDVRHIIERQIEFNSRVSNEGLANCYGANVGRTLMENFGGNDVKIRASARAAAASDARMGGCALPVVINSGSGNQGITVSLPVVTYAEALKASQESLIRALALANLMALLQKRYIGPLSAFCSAVGAAAGAAAGITYLHGGRYKEVSQTVTNTLANVGGIVCDGAKASCAAKIASAVNAAILGFTIQETQNYAFPSGDGIVKDSIDKTISSVGRMGRDGMRHTDVEILNIMLEP